MKSSSPASATKQSSEGPPLPILKWAGGKRALLPQIMPKIPSFTGTYFEPFLGAGALFFSMPEHLRKVGNDYNRDLIELYRVVRDNPNGLLDELKKHRNTKEHFYEVRAWDREASFRQRSAVERAARLIFLNKTCFNGLYRVNSRNEFNVPFGDLKNPDFVSEKNLLKMSSFLRSRKNGSRLVTLKSGDYRTALRGAREGDFVYLDPPYDPLSKTSSFVSYQTSGFSSADQEALKQEIDDLTSRGVPVLLSNSATPFIRKLFSDTAVFRTRRISATRTIGASISSRGKTAELLIDNFRATLGK